MWGRDVMRQRHAGGAQRSAGMGTHPLVGFFVYVHDADTSLNGSCRETWIPLRKQSAAMCPRHLQHQPKVVTRSLRGSWMIHNMSRLEDEGQQTLTSGKLPIHLSCSLIVWCGSIR